MAEINVERKRTSVWTWVIALVVLAVLVWALMELFSGDDEPAQPAAVEEVGALPAAAPPVLA